MENYSDSPEEIALILAGLSSIHEKNQSSPRHLESATYPSPESTARSPIDNAVPEIKRERLLVKTEHVEYAAQHTLPTPQASPYASEFRRFKMVGNILNEYQNDPQEAMIEENSDVTDYVNYPDWHRIYQVANSTLLKFGSSSCPVCGKAFHRICNFKTHFKVHLAKRPYECSICSSKFLRKHDLNRHEKIHTGVKPFKCERCGKGFVRKDALRRHENMESSVQSYRCVPLNKSKTAA